MIWGILGILIVIVLAGIMQYRSNESARKELIASQRKDTIQKEQNVNRLKDQGYIFLSVNKIDKKYGYAVPEEVRDAITNAILKGESTVPIHENTLAEMDTKLREHKKQEKDFSDLMELQSNGKTYEELFALDEAITEYEKCVDFGEKSPHLHISNYLHSIERLAILYRKKKLYEKERTLLESALKNQMHKNQRAKLETRLTKVLEIIEKQNKINGQKQSI